MNSHWKDHPRLRHRWHPEHPDRLRVLLHDGGPHTAKAPPELHTVQVVERRGQVFFGSLLSTPRRLVRTRVGDRVAFLVPHRAPHPVQVRDDYLAERRQWRWEPCGRCGFSELFDPPSQLLQRHSGDAELRGQPRFETSCPLCGGCVRVETNPSTRRLRRPKRRARRAHSVAGQLQDGPGTALATPPSGVRPAAAPVFPVSRSKGSGRWLAMPRTQLPPVRLEVPPEAPSEPEVPPEPGCFAWVRGPLGDFIYWSTVVLPFPWVMLRYPVNYLVSFLALTVCCCWLFFLTCLHGFLQRLALKAEDRGWRGSSWTVCRCLLDLFEPRWDVGLTLRSLLRQ